MQSTLGQELAALLNLPFISLDTLYWGPGWREATRDEFVANVRAALDKSPHGWVIDGNYTNKVGSLITDLATDIICKPHPCPTARRPSCS